MNKIFVEAYDTDKIYVELDDTTFELNPMEARIVSAKLDQAIQEAFVNIMKEEILDGDESPVSAPTRYLNLALVPQTYFALNSNS